MCSSLVHGAGEPWSTCLVLAASALSNTGDKLGKCSSLPGEDNGASICVAACKTSRMRCATATEGQASLVWCWENTNTDNPVTKGPLQQCNACEAGVRFCTEGSVQIGQSSPLRRAPFLTRLPDLPAEPTLLICCGVILQQHCTLRRVTGNHLSN